MGCLLLIWLLLSFPRGGSSIGRDESEAGNCGDCGHGGIGSGMDRSRRSEGEGCKSCHWLKVKSALEKKDFQVVMTRETDVRLYDEDSNNRKGQ